MEIINTYLRHMEAYIYNLDKRLALMQSIPKTRPKSFLSNAQRIEKARQICELYSYGIYNIESCCNAVDVPYMTFKDWAQPNATEEMIEKKLCRRGFVLAIHLMYKEALENNTVNYKLLVKQKVREGLLLKATGLDYEEVRTEVKVDKETGQSLPVSISRTSKKILPDTTALIFMAKNVDSETFKDSVEQVHTGSLNLTTGLQGKSYEELKEMQKQIEAQLESEDGLLAKD